MLTDRFCVLLKLSELGLRKLEMALVFSVGGPPGVGTRVGPAQGTSREFLF